MTAWLGLVKAAVTLHLFFGAKKRDSLTVTDKMVYWVMPSAVKSVPCQRIKEVKFFKSPGAPVSA